MPEALQPSPNGVADACETFPISTVARLTGLSVHTIRAWEKRYGVVEPLRTETQRRAYTPEDVRKLSLLRALIEAGRPISSIARLPVHQLERSLDSAAPGEAGRTLRSSPGECICASPRQIGVVGYSLLSLFESQAALLAGMEVACAWESLEVALDAGPSETPLDLLVVETETLFPERASRIRDLAARTLANRVIIVYGFAPRQTVASLNRTPRFLALRWPVNVEELELAVSRSFEHAPPAPSAPSPPATAAPPESPVPVRLFTPKQLARIARMSSSHRCECPQHLANLVISLAAFETYSNECQSQGPVDIALHTLMHRATAQARRDLELALKEVLDREGLRI